MKKLLIMGSILFVSCFLLTACDGFHRSDAGLVTGGVVGGVAGNALTGGSAVGTVAGAVGGAYVGHELAK